MRRDRIASIVLVAATALACGAAGARAQATRPLTERQRVAQWSNDILVGEYNRHAKHHPAWDEPAREALAAYARMIADDPRQTGDELDTMFFSCRTAMQGGCKDPLVQLVAARASFRFERRRDEWLGMHVEAAHRILQTEYHPFWKCSAAFLVAEYEGQLKKDPGALADAKRMLDAGMELLPRVLLDESVPRGEKIDLFRMMTGAAKVVEGEREPTTARLMAAVDPKLEDRSLSLSLMARFYLDYAWDVRAAEAGGEPDRRLIRERLQTAAMAGEEAWNLDQTNGRAAKLMMRTMLGLGDDELRTTWFARAAEAEPDDFTVYTERLEALEPKWGGSAEAMLNFGRGCLERGNWDARIPFVLVEAHLALSRYARDGYKPQPQPQYFRNNPEAWQDVRAVYEEYLKRTESPSLFHRSRYAELALWCGQYAVAAEQFAAMGDKFSYGWFRNDSRYNRARAELAAHAPQEPTDRR